MTRVAIGGIRYESNSFAGTAASPDCFVNHAIRRGSEVLEVVEPNSELRGALEAAATTGGVELVPLLDTFGGCGAPVLDGTYVALRDELIQRLTAAGPVDAVYLPLHGAMTSTGRTDAEADLAAEVRRVVGPDVPLVVSFDLHAAVSARTIELVDAVVGFKTCPHTDYVETGHRAATLAIRAARGEIRPAVVRVPVPMLTAAEAHDTTSGPLAQHMVRLQREIAEVGLLDGSIFACQPWLDTPRSTWTVTVTYDAPRGADAQALARLTGDRLLADLDSFRIAKTGVDDVWTAIGELGAATVLVADSGDSPSAGAPGDSVDCLRVLIAPDRPSVLATVTDPDAVTAAVGAGIGARLRVRVGGALTPGLGASCELDVTVLAVADGCYVQEYPAAPVDVGRCVVVRCANADLVITSRPAFMLDTALMRHLGIDVRAYRVVQVKSAGGFRALWSTVSRDVVVVDSLGASTSRLTDLPFQQLPERLWPFAGSIPVHGGAA